MTLKYAGEITANLQRAEASIQAAKELASKSYYDFVASRAYYAAFYAATALLLSKELEFSRHSGVIASIHQRFVKTGKLDKRHGKDLNWLFELRGVGDYGATIHVSQQDAVRAIEIAEDFLETTKLLIQDETI
ncbi:unnamed protein product [marine sediment metagenome]|uniref:HEPN domain-containing protein n=1 Tax=marine sediment metagenome TaxID=412755 RepID=X0RGT7_9ZZZZ